MKKLLLGILSAFLLQTVVSTADAAKEKLISPSFLTFTNPVIPGDHPDPTLTKVGEDFYTAGSSFNPTPIIYHSTDLVHWRAIAKPVSAAWEKYDDKNGAGCWGGHLIQYDGMFWYFFSRGGSMYFAKSKKIEGPWETPVKIKEPTGALPYTMGYDNSVFVDDNGKWYLVVKNGQANNGIVELNNEGQPTGVVYDLKWLNPRPKFPFSWAEGPVMWKESGFYYYSFAKNVSGGQWVMRSKSMTADSAAWEMQGYFFDEEDPLKNTAIFKTPNHASPVVKLADGTSWVISQSYAENEWKGHGRQGLLTQVKYVNGKPISEYPANRVFQAPKLPNKLQISWMVPKSDFFDEKTIHPEWSHIGYTSDTTVNFKKRLGWLFLQPKVRMDTVYENGQIDTIIKVVKSNTLTKIEGEKNYSMMTRVDFSALSIGAQAGLQVLCSNERDKVRLYTTMDSSKRQVICFSDGVNTTSVNKPSRGILWLKIVRVNHLLSGYYSYDGTNWTVVGKGFSAKKIDATAAGWVGTRIGIYVEKQAALFDLFIYRDAYTPIMAGWPANRNGVECAASENESLLKSIDNNDWAMYAGVEFGGHDNYLKTPKYIEFNAACTTQGGLVEIWLDAIDTGKKIGECEIGNTGAMDQYQTFRTKIKKAKGVHDVYIRFKGEKDMFVLESLVFSVE